MSCSSMEQREYCLRRVLNLNPNHPEAIKQLAALSKSAPAPKPTPPSPSPVNIPKPLTPAMTSSPVSPPEKAHPATVQQRPLSLDRKGIDEMALKELEDKRRDSSPPESSSQFILGVGGGCVSVFVAAMIWALVAFITGYQFSLLAIGVGYLVGFTVKVAGNSRSLFSGMMAAFLSAFGCVFGNYLAICVLVAREVGAPVAVVALNLLFTPQALGETLGFIFGYKEITFYGIAMYASFKTSS